jgi:hypothetical protein
VLATPDVRRFYRIVRSKPPRLGDFVSARARGLEPRDQQRRTPVLYTGISVYDTLARAWATAVAFPRLGQYVAEMEVPPDSGVEIHKTLGVGHHTLVGEPDVLLGLVVDVVDLEG